MVENVRKITTVCSCADWSHFFSPTIAAPPAHATRGFAIFSVHRAKQKYKGYMRGWSPERIFGDRTALVYMNMCACHDDQSHFVVGSPLVASIKGWMKIFSQKLQKYAFIAVWKSIILKCMIPSVAKRKSY